MHREQWLKMFPPIGYSAGIISYLLALLPFKMLYGRYL